MATTSGGLAAIGYRDSQNGPPEHPANKGPQLGDGSLYGNNWRTKMQAWVTENSFTFPSPSGCGIPGTSNPQMELCFRLWLEKVRIDPNNVQAVMRKGSELRSIERTDIGRYLSQGWTEYTEIND